MTSSRLNVEKALKKLGGSHKLFKILLVGFSVKYAKVDQEISVLSIEGRFEEAQRLSHSLKGLSGNLGAEKLRLCALKLENVYKNVPSEYKDPLKKFSLELSEVVSEVKSILETYNEASNEAAPVLEIREHTDETVIYLLIDALESFQYGLINEALLNFKRYKFTDETREIASVINELISLYDYNQARIQLDLLLKRIN